MIQSEKSLFIGLFRFKMKEKMYMKFSMVNVILFNKASTVELPLNMYKGKSINLKVLPAFWLQSFYLRPIVISSEIVLKEENILEKLTHLFTLHNSGIVAGGGLFLEEFCTALDPTGSQQRPGCSYVT